MVETIQELEVVNLVRTPLGASLEAVAVDLGRAPGPKIVVFVTDGEETCGGDSAAAIQALVDSGIDVRVNIVGFALDDEALKAQFEEWARIGNGRYIDAGNQAELTAAVAEAVLPVYRILDEDGDPVGTGQVGGEAVAVPPGTYTIEISGTPRIRIGEVVVRSGEETVVGLDDGEESSGSGAPIGLAGVIALAGIAGCIGGGGRRREGFQILSVYRWGLIVEARCTTARCA